MDARVDLAALANGHRRALAAGEHLKAEAYRGSDLPNSDDSVLTVAGGSTSTGPE